MNSWKIWYDADFEVDEEEKHVYIALKVVRADIPSWLGSKDSFQFPPRPLLPLKRYMLPIPPWGDYEIFMKDANKNDTIHEVKTCDR